METATVYNCPVCGYGGLPSRPVNHAICPSCGTEFGYDDFAVSHQELRRIWLNSGGRWWSKRMAPPDGWTAAAQLEHAEKAGFAGFAPLVGAETRT